MSDELNNGTGASEGAVPSHKRRANPAVLVGLQLLMLIVIGSWYYFAHGTEDTDDAQVDGHLVPVASRIEGTVQGVTVEDNQKVKAGETLVTLDPSDYQVALDQAK